MGTITTEIDERRYGRLLAKATPRVIETDEAHQRALSQIEELLEKGEAKRTPEEDALLALLGGLVHDYEERAAPLPKRSRLNFFWRPLSARF